MKSITKKAQKWLNRNYFNKSEVIKISKIGEKLEGELTISNFPNLQNIDLGRQNLTKLQVIGCPRLRNLYCSNGKLEKLCIGDSQAVNLSHLSFSDNKLRKIDLDSFPNLRFLNASNNLLTNLDLTKQQLLEKLQINDNDFFEQDLSFLSHLVNLTCVRLGNFQEVRISQNIYNRFKGSLKALEKLNKLEELDIRNTDISSGLEHLPIQSL